MKRIFLFVLINFMLTPINSKASLNNQIWKVFEYEDYDYKFLKVIVDSDYIISPLPSPPSVRGTINIKIPYTFNNQELIQQLRVYPIKIDKVLYGNIDVPKIFILENTSFHCWVELSIGKSKSTLIMLRKIDHDELKGITSNELNQLMSSETVLTYSANCSSDSFFHIENNGNIEGKNRKYHFLRNQLVNPDFHSVADYITNLKIFWEKLQTEKLNPATIDIKDLDPNQVKLLKIFQKLSEQDILSTNEYRSFIPCFANK